MWLPNGWPHKVSSIFLSSIQLSIHLLAACWSLSQPHSGESQGKPIATTHRALSEYLGVWCFAQMHLDSALKVCWHLSCYLHNCSQLVLAKISNSLCFLFLISSLLIQKTNRKTSKSQQTRADPCSQLISYLNLQ